MKKTKKIKSGLWARSSSLGGAVLKGGMGWLHSHYRGKERQGILPVKNWEELVSQLGLMKGSVMKVGQMLSLQGAEFLPAEVRDILARLENQTSYLDWESIQGQLSPYQKEVLEVNPVPFAAASLGQVHRAWAKSSDLQLDPESRELAVKIRYPNIDKAIDTDLWAIKMIFKTARLMPREFDLNEVLSAVKTMLRQEMDYQQELAWLGRYGELARPVEGVLTPKPLASLCTSETLVMSFMEGLPLRDARVQEMGQERRNRLGEILLDLFFREIFEWGIVQTDAHFGNFLIQQEAEHAPKDRWALLDFGATQEVEKEFLVIYQNLIKACILRDRELLENSLCEMGHLHNPPPEMMDTLWEYVLVLGGPFQQDSYQWGGSPIVRDLMGFAPKIMKDFSRFVRRPPGRSLFLDRKVAGVFHILKHLKAETATREVALRYF